MDASDDDGAKNVNSDEEKDIAQQKNVSDGEAMDIISNKVKETPQRIENNATGKRRIRKRKLIKRKVANMSLLWQIILDIFRSAFVFCCSIATNMYIEINSF